ncbi:MAG: thiol peroxidase [Lentisphaeria bacterium]|nr:thiol peroxidase [Lentisphaeria bacterium]
MRVLPVVFGLALGIAAGCRSTAPVHTVTANGAALTLDGRMPALGRRCPDFRVVDGEFRPVRLSDFRGSVVVISTVPSLDTGVCSLQTVRFNQEAAGLPENVVVLTVSMDLPFAQKRFCSAQGVDRVRVLSDIVDRDAGRALGLLIRERGILARAVLVVDRRGRLQYRQVVAELTEHPNYEAALETARDLASSF